MSKRIGHVYFTSTSTIGIVLMHDEIEKKLKAYIKSLPGYGEEADLKAAEEYGAKFPVEEAISLINKFGYKDCSLIEYDSLTLMKDEVKNSDS